MSDPMERFDVMIQHAPAGTARPRRFPTPRITVRYVTMLLGASLALSCAGAARARPAELLRDARERAARRPGDMLAQRDRALAELVAPGGDAAEATRGLERLRTSAATDVRVRFALAQLEMQHGDFTGGVRDLAAALEHARTGSDPLRNEIAEVVVGDLVSVRGNVRDFGATFAPALDRLSRDPGNLGAAATFRALETAIRWAREMGDSDRQERWVRASGCVTGWRVAGPFGPHPMLQFDRELPPEGPTPWPADFDVGPGRPRRATWTVQARGCASNLGAGRTENGVFYAATDFVLDRDRDVVVHAHSPNIFRIDLDARPVATLDGRTRPTGTGLAVPVRLRAGRHTLRMKVGSRFFSPLVVAAITDPSGRPVATFEPAAGGAHESEPIVLGPADEGAHEAAQNDPSLAPFDRFVFAAHAFARSNPVAARELFRPLATATEGVTPMVSIAWASAALADPFTPSGVARDRARRALDRARRADPRAYYPPIALARLAAADDRGDEALALSRAVYERMPTNPEVQSDYAERLLDRSWDGEALVVINRAMEQFPDACWPVRLRLSLAQRRSDGEAERALAESIGRCDALSDAAALAAVRQRRWDSARGEFERLLGTDPEGRGLRRALVDVVRQRGDLTQASAAARAILGENPEDVSLRLDLADIESALGEDAQAARMLDREFSHAPSVFIDLVRARSVLDRSALMAPWRLDGRDVLRTFNASNVRYQAPAVLALDYTVRRAFADGSALELTHNIFRLQSQEGVDAHATVSLPEGAMLLTARTHKADGRVLEPEAIARLDAVAFPDVGIGDAIEYEYIRALNASESVPGGFSTERFFFRGYEVPYDRSELVVVLPRTVAERARIETRGPAPTLVRRELPGELSEFRWSVRQSDRLVPEPRSIAAREFLPSVIMAADWGWERYVDALRERLADADPYDPEAARLVRTIVGSARRPSEKLRRLHRWVLEHVAQEGGGTPFASAPVMLAGRAGHRTRTLCYLLGLEQIPCTMALVRPGNMDRTEARIADEETFPSVLLRVRTERGLVWVTAADRSAPISWIPPQLNDQPAMLLSAGGPRVRIDPFDPTQHTREIAVNLSIGRDGAARAEVTERLHGAWAVSWRETLRQIDPANLRQEFENYVGRQVTAASLTDLRIEGAEDLEADVVLRYAFTAPAVASPTDGGLLFEGVYSAEVSAAYATLPRRTTTLYNGDALDATLELKVDVPDGMRVAELPRDRSGHATGIDWSTSYERRGSGFRYVRRLQMPPGRVTPEQYAAFATQVRAVDAADGQRVVIAGGR